MIVLRRRYPIHALGMIALLVLILGAIHADAQLPESDCQDGRPAYGAPSELWGELRPVDTGQLPASRDTTRWNGQQSQGPATPLWLDIDPIAGGFVTGMKWGFQVWSTANPRSPLRQSQRNIRTLEGGQYFLNMGVSELQEYFVQGDTAEYLGRWYYFQVGNAGVALWDVTTQRLPVQLYQHGERYGERPAADVWLGVADGRLMGFVAVSEGLSNGLHWYDLTGALSPSCTREERGGCSGVYRGKVGQIAFPFTVAGTDDGHIFAGSRFSDLEVLKVAAAGVTSLGRIGYRALSLEAWEDHGTIVAARSSSGVDLWQLIGTPVAANSGFIPLASIARKAAEFRDKLAYSSGYLYVGHGNACDRGLATEALYDVSDPSRPRDISPTATKTVRGITYDYWGHYYARNPSGFSLLRPFAAFVRGGLVYRAANTILDAHEIVDAPDPPPDPDPPPAECLPLVELSAPIEGHLEVIGARVILHPGASVRQGATLTVRGCTP